EVDESSRISGTTQPSDSARLRNMKTLSLSIRMLLGTAAISLAMAQSAYAFVPPALRLTDGVSTITIDSTNAVTCSGICTYSSSSASGGIITWVGTLGVFNITATGQTKPAMPPPSIDLSFSV